MPIEINRKDRLSSAYATLLEAYRTGGLVESHAIFHIRDASAVVAAMDEIGNMCRRTIPEPEVLYLHADRLVDAIKDYWKKNRYARS